MAVIPGARPLSVLAVTLRYPPYVAGGYELLTRDAVEALRHRGHRVTVLAGRGARLAGTADVLSWLEPGLDGAEDLFERSFRASNLERLRLHFLRLANYRATLRALRASGAEALLFFNLGLVSLAPVLAARHAGVPTLGYVADLWPANHWLASWKEDTTDADKAARRALLQQGWRAFRGAVGLGPLLVASAWLGERLIADGLDARAIAVLPLGVPPDLAPGAAPRARVRGEALRIVCASTLWRGKGQDVLIEAVAQARERGAELEVTLAGGGRADWRAELERRRDELGLAERVRFTGPLERAELGRLFSSAHVVVVPSTWGEPFGLVTLEGLAHGAAVVVSDAGASPELITDGVDGRVVRAGSAPALAAALCELEADEERRFSLAAAGRASVARRFAHDEFIAALERELAHVARGSEA